MFYAYKGIKANSNRPDAVLRNFPYLGIAGVGIGSAVFHATMKNYTQWCRFIPSDITGIFILDLEIQLEERERVSND